MTDEESDKDIQQKASRPSPLSTSIDHHPLYRLCYHVPQPFSADNKSAQGDNEEVQGKIFKQVSYMQVN